MQVVYITHGEWDVGPRATTVPAGWTLVGCKWMFKVKHGSGGRVEPFKGSLIVKVYTQVWHWLWWDILTGMILLNPDTAGLCSEKQHAKSSDGCCNGTSEWITGWRDLHAVTRWLHWMWKGASWLKVEEITVWLETVPSLLEQVTHINGTWSQCGSSRVQATFSFTRETQECQRMLQCMWMT